MTGEQAVYFRLLLLCGYSDELESFVDTALEIEDPLSSVVLELATCSADPKRMLSVLNGYISSQKQNAIDYDGAVFCSILSFLKRKYEIDKMPVKELTDLMYKIAVQTDRYDIEPWFSMCYMRDYHDEAIPGGQASLDEFSRNLQLFINEGRPLTKKPAVRQVERTYSDIEKRYQRLNKWNNLFAVVIVIPLLVLSLLLAFAKDDTMMLVSALLLISWTAVIIIVCSMVGKKRSELQQKLWEERNSVKRTGIYKKLYEEFCRDGFEFNIQLDKFLFDDCHKNFIEFGFVKNGHEFSAAIDENAVSFIVDEETEHPAEISVPLEEIESIDRFYEIINAYVDANS